jgi:hypothetical protein
MILSILALIAQCVMGTSIVFDTDGQIVDGQEYFDVIVNNGAQVDMYGGIISNDLGINDEVFNLYGGYVSGVYNRSKYNMYGGEAYWVWSENFAVTNIYGGRIENLILVYPDSIAVNIYGGELLLTNDKSIIAYSNVNIFGYGFDYNSASEILSGYLSDGNPFSFTGVTQSELDDLYNLIIIPEPATILLLGLGSLAVVRRKK